MSIGAQLISEERWRQQSAEGYTSEHDDAHAEQELGWAAAAYLAAYLCQDVNNLWPWETESFKISGDPVRELVKAGALIAAEIDRRVRQDDISHLRQEHTFMKSALHKIAAATRVDGNNKTFMEWADMKSLARRTLDAIP